MLWLANQKERAVYVSVCVIFRVVGPAVTLGTSIGFAEKLDLGAVHAILLLSAMSPYVRRGVMNLLVMALAVIYEMVEMGVFVDSMEQEGWVLHSSTHSSFYAAASTMFPVITAMFFQLPFDFVLAMMMLRVIAIFGVMWTRRTFLEWAAFKSVGIWLMLQFTLHLVLFAVGQLRERRWAEAMVEQRQLDAEKESVKQLKAEGECRGMISKLLSSRHCFTSPLLLCFIIANGRLCLSW